MEDEEEGRSAGRRRRRKGQELSNPFELITNEEIEDDLTSKEEKDDSRLKEESDRKNEESLENDQQKGGAETKQLDQTVNAPGCCV
ncbi:uncharacterized protein LOC134295192 [Anolis carolinensis]|uniref:uncharacterized protein LOC134295192 n=1 Tax=Anolis carolinensis TaxID=28377 RepID=UPI002F2B4B37